MHDIVEVIMNGRGISKQDVRDMIGTDTMKSKQAFDIGLIYEPLNQD